MIPHFSKALLAIGFILSSACMASLSSPTEVLPSASVEATSVESHQPKGNKKRKNYRANKGNILQAIMHHKNDELRQMIEKKPDTHWAFVRSMAKRAVLFKNIEAIDILMRVYGHLSKRDQSHREDYIEAETTLISTVAREVAFFGYTSEMKTIFNKYPQHKFKWLEEFLSGASESGNQEVVNWVLSFLPEIKRSSSAQDFFRGCQGSIGSALEGYNSQIAIQIAQSCGHDFLLKDLKLYIRVAVHFEDRQFLNFVKKSFPQQYRDIIGAVTQAEADSKARSAASDKAFIKRGRNSPLLMHKNSTISHEWG